jgi:hydroxyacylglutathione hydrolase
MINKLKSNIYQMHFTNFSSCVYLLKLDKNILIDTGSPQAKKELLRDLKEIGITPQDISIIILTHSHWDHTGNTGLFPNAEIYTHSNIDSLSIRELRIIKTPGHTKDSIALLYQDILFSGDTLFHNGIGRTDFPESNPEKMQDSLNKLHSLKYKILAPGHL